ncbi:hypothetical protein QQ045_006539 [Rhodiola kirilowii]
MIKLGSMESPHEVKHWDYNGRSQVYQIFVSYGADKIYGLQFQYLDNCLLVLSDPLGSMSGPSFKVGLNYNSVNYQKICYNRFFISF